MTLQQLINDARRAEADAQARPQHGEHCRDRKTGEIACGWPELHNKPKPPPARMHT